MCNPRRIEVRLSQDIEEQWSAPVEVQALEHAEVSEAVERSIDLRRRLGATAARELSAALSDGFRGWREEGEGFILERDGIRLTYTPDSGQLSIRAEAQEVIEARGTGRAEARQTVRGQYEVVGVGTTYDDAPESHQAQAQKNAEEDAKKKAEAQRQSFVEEQTREVRQAAEARAREDAQSSARVNAEAEAEAARARVRGRAEEAIRRAAPIVQQETSALLGETLRRSVHRLVRDNGGYIQTEREDEFETVIEAII